MLVTSCSVCLVDVCDLSYVEMASHIMDSAVETDGAGPHQNVAEVIDALAAGAPVDIELQQQQQQQQRQVNSVTNKLINSI